VQGYSYYDAPPPSYGSISGSGFHTPHEASISTYIDMHDDADNEYSSTSSFVENANDALVRKVAELTLENDDLQSRITDLKTYLWAVFVAWMIFLWLLMWFIMDTTILACKKSVI
jgi:hypothetical protein